MRKFLIAFAFLLTLIHSGHAEQACGIGEDDCQIELGEYNIELPARADPSIKIPAMLYFHGAGGTGQRSLKNREMVETFLKRGYAVIAPSGLKKTEFKIWPRLVLSPGTQESSGMNSPSRKQF